MDSPESAQWIEPATMGAIKAKDFVLIRGHPCRVESVTHSKTGKHGHAKCRFFSHDLVTGRRSEDCQPAHSRVFKAKVKREEYLLVSVPEARGDKDVSLMSADGQEMLRVTVDDSDKLAELKEAAEEQEIEGDIDVFVSVLSVPVVDSKKFYLKQVITAVRQERDNK